MTDKPVPYLTFKTPSGVIKVKAASEPIINFNPARDTAIDLGQCCYGCYVMFDGEHGAQTLCKGCWEAWDPMEKIGLIEATQTERDYAHGSKKYREAELARIEKRAQEVAACLAEKDHPVCADGASESGSHSNNRRRSRTGRKKARPSLFA